MFNVTFWINFLLINLNFMFEKRKKRSTGVDHSLLLYVSSLLKPCTHQFITETMTHQFITETMYSLVQMMYSSVHY